MRQLPCLPRRSRLTNASSLLPSLLISTSLQLLLSDTRFSTRFPISSLGVISINFVPHSPAPTNGGSSRCP
ncbi:hypothetical protein DFH28DRAFT_1002410 [Melampsora americana]|nr:hypothetical protein DFH28DRAFT_1002410 [Melampsora americana]